MKNLKKKTIRGIFFRVFRPPYDHDNIIIMIYHALVSMLIRYKQLAECLRIKKYSKFPD